jgi:Zn-dependent peptidase ImmA (M78 family)
MRKPKATDADELERALARFWRRWAYVSQRNVEAFAGSFAEWIGAKRLPRDVFLICEALGIRLRADALLAQRAAWSQINGHYVISYQPVEGSRGRASFSIAHELAEIIFSHPRARPLMDASEERRLANHFATALLMPADEVKARFENYRANRTNLAPLIARDCKTSETAVRRRLRELGLRLGRLPMATALW